MKVLKFGMNSPAAQQAKIEHQLLDQLEGVLYTIFPKGSTSNGEFIIGDVNGKAGKSLNVCLNGEKRGVWHDFATGESGHILDLIAAHYDLKLKSQLGHVLDKAKQLLADLDKYSKTEMPSIGTKISQALQKVAEWDYLAADESYLWTIIRFVDAANIKQVRPYSKVTKEWKSHPEPRPLFNLPGISKSQQIILVEGEKCAQALIDMGYCATTAMGGAAAPPSKTDWSPLSGKTVLIWPDNDEPGKKYAGNCAQALLAAGAVSCDVLVIPESMPSKWDAADALDSGSDFDVKKFIADGERLAIEKPNAEALNLAFVNADWRTENGIAQVLTEIYGKDWKYCSSWGQWFKWNGHRWVHDQVLAFHHLAREVAYAASECADRDGIRAKLASSATASNIERLARADPMPLHTTNP
jgi:putative DNA primase/helicase